MGGRHGMVCGRRDCLLTEAVSSREFDGYFRAHGTDTGLEGWRLSLVTVHLFPHGIISKVGVIQGHGFMACYFVHHLYYMRQAMIYYEQQSWHSIFKLIANNSVSWEQFNHSGCRGLKLYLRYLGRFTDTMPNNMRNRELQPVFSKAIYISIQYMSRLGTVYIW